MKSGSGFFGPWSFKWGVKLYSKSIRSWLWNCSYMTSFLLNYGFWCLRPISKEGMILTFFLCFQISVRYLCCNSQNWVFHPYLKTSFIRRELYRLMKKSAPSIISRILDCCLATYYVHYHSISWPIFEGLFTNCKTQSAYISILQLQCQFFQNSFK